MSERLERVWFGDGKKDRWLDLHQTENQFSYFLLDDGTEIKLSPFDAQRLAFALFKVIEGPEPGCQLCGRGGGA